MRQSGFTLAELLIALAILGVIATFTIPKVLNGSQSQQKKSMALEAAAMLSGAFQEYKLHNPVTAATGFKDFTPYFNYVRIDTTSIVDRHHLATSHNCSTADMPCFVLHNGSYVWNQHVPDAFLGTSDLHCLEMGFDTNDTYSGVTTGEDKGVQFMLYFNGALTSRAHPRPGATGCGPYGVNNYDPPWFKWD